MKVTSFSFDSPGLVDFIHTETFYSVTRRLPGDLKLLYSGPGSGQIPLDENPFLSNFEPRPHKTKGGMILTNYLTFNCVEDPEDSIRLEWTCEFCEQVCETLNRCSNQMSKHQPN